MKYRVLGTSGSGQRFDIEVFAACAREAEVFVSLRSACQNESPNIAGVLDVARQTIHCTDRGAPELQDFRSMLVELRDVIRIGRVSFSASKEYQWLCSVIENEECDPNFFRYCEKRLQRATDLSSPESEIVSEHLIRLAAIGISLLESRVVPNTQNLFDLMWQVRTTAIVYGPVLPSAFNRVRLQLVRPAL